MTVYPAYFAGYTQHTAGAEIRAETAVCLQLLGRSQAFSAVEQDIDIHDVTHRAVPLCARSSETRPRYPVLIQTPATLLERLRMSEEDEDERGGAGGASRWLDTGAENCQKLMVKKLQLEFRKTPPLLLSSVAT